MALMQVHGPGEEPCWNICPWNGDRCDLAKGHPGGDPNWCAAFWNGVSHHGWDNRVSINAPPKVVEALIAHAIANQEADHA